MSNMLNEILYLPELIEEQIATLDKAVREVLSFREITSIKEIVFTGCGDSWFAGLGAKRFFQKVCNIQTGAIRAMEASRYDLVDYQSAFPRNPLVLAISVSGRVVRTLEAMKIAQANNSLAIALVGDLESPLAISADRIIPCKLKALPRSPGVASYRVSQLALFLFGIHIAEVKRRISATEGNRLRDQLKSCADQIAWGIKANSDIAQELASQMVNNKYYTFLGDGPHLASAHFAAAKITEGVGYIAVPQETEEWAHLQYFENAFSEIPTFLITSKGRGYARMLELLVPMKRVGRKIIAVCENSCEELVSQSDYHLSVSEDINPFFAPIVYPVGIELFTTHLSDLIGAGYYRENIEGYPRYGNTIRDNQLLSKDEIEAL